jgi:hypothetical protein
VRPAARPRSANFSRARRCRRPHRLIGRLCCSTPVPVPRIARVLIARSSTVSMTIVDCTLAALSMGLCV